MSAPLYIKVKDADNVAIAVHDIPRGTEIMPGVVTREDIPVFAQSTIDNQQRLLKNNYVPLTLEDITAIYQARL